MDLEEALRGRVDALLKSLRVMVSAGIRGDYLVISAGPSTAHLGRLASGPSLAASRALAAVRRCFKPGLVSLAYLDARLASTAKMPVDELVSGIEAILNNVGGENLPEGFLPRLKKDARAFVEDLNRGIPEPAPWTSVSFLDRGIESYTFSALDLSANASRPLDILAHAGRSALLAFAFRKVPCAGDYEQLTHWIEVAYGYFQDYIVPRVPREDRAQLGTFQKFFVPALKELHETTRKLLLPAIDGCQGLVAADGGGLLATFPGDAEPLPRPLRYLRPALVLEVNDAEKLAQAFAAYRQTLNRFFRDAGKDLRLPALAIPVPSTRPHAGGVLYTYPLPVATGPEFEPHALIAGKYAVLSLSPAQSQGIIEARAAVPEGIVDLKAPAGEAYWVDVAGLGRLVLDVAGVMLERERKAGAITPGAVFFIGSHFPVLQEVLGTLKGYSARAYIDHGLQAHHSWLWVEDLTDG
jgi:hypothetical protein